MSDSISPADLAARLREHDAAMTPEFEFFAGSLCAAGEHQGHFDHDEPDWIEWIQNGRVYPRRDADGKGFAFLRNHAAALASHLERLAALEAAGLEECLSMTRKRLIAHGCQCGPGVHEATPPMCYDDWISCAIKSAVSKVEAERDALRAELDRLREPLTEGRAAVERLVEAATKRMKIEETRTRDIGLHDDEDYTFSLEDYCFASAQEAAAVVAWREIDRLSPVAAAAPAAEAKPECTCEPFDDKHGLQDWHCANCGRRSGPYGHIKGEGFYCKPCPVHGVTAAPKEGG